MQQVDSSMHHNTVQEVSFGVADVSPNAGRPWKRGGTSRNQESEYALVSRPIGRDVVGVGWNDGI